MGTCKWPYTDEGNGVKLTEIEKERGENLGGGDTSEEEGSGSSGDDSEVWVSSAVAIEKSSRPPVTTVRLLRGERLGWLSSKKFDKRIRMRALIKGAVNDTRVRILLDTGANVSVITTRMARKLRLRHDMNNDQVLEVQGIKKGKMSTTRRSLVKVTLGWERVYEFDLWIMDHSAGVDVVLGMDFMIPAGIRLDLFHGTAQLPDEVRIPLIKTQATLDDEFGRNHLLGGPTEDLQIPAHEWVEFRLRKRKPSLETHTMWIRRTEKFVPTVTKSRRGQPEQIRLTNITDKLASCPMHFDIVAWVPHGDLPVNDGYVRVDSRKYQEWQVIAYAESRDETLYERETKLYEDWLSRQPPAVERVKYPTPAGVKARPTDDSGGEGTRLTCAQRWERILEERDKERPEDGADGLLVGNEPAPTSAGPSSMPPQDVVTGVTAKNAVNCPARMENEHSSDGSGDDTVAADPVATLEHAFAAIMQASTTQGTETRIGNEDSSELPASYLELEDYAHELAFLPDLTEASVTVLDYSAPNVRSASHDEHQQHRLVDVLKKHEQIMISSGNALPPPAYGVVCDIDVKRHAPIKQRARRVPLRHLQKLYELLKGLLKAGLISFSDSPWASPIVIVLKKNDKDIRLCIDYKMVNAITAIMEYAMPLVDDLLTDLECYLWFCSLDAASGFWAIMMTQRARKISAFVCALGHFEWLRMPFGLKNAPMIYQRMIDNALWGFVQPKGGWNHYAALMEDAEIQAQTLRGNNNDASVEPSTGGPSPRTRFEADREASDVLDPVSELINSPIADMFSNGETDTSALVPVFGRRSFVDDICYGGQSFDDCLSTLDRLLSRFEECRISVSFTKSIFVQSKVDFLSHQVSTAGIQADPKKLEAITVLSFPISKKGMQSFLGALNYYSRFIQDFAVYGAALYQLKDEYFGSSGDLTTARCCFAALQQKVATAPILRHFCQDKEVHVMLFANEWALSTTLMQERDGKLHPVRFCGRVLKDAEMNYHPAEKEVLALLLLLKQCYTQLAGRIIHVYTRFSTLDWVHRSKSLFGRAVQFSVLLSPWHLKVQRVKEKDCAFAQLLQSTITSFVDLEDSLAPIAPPSKGSPTIRMDPSLLNARLPRDYRGLVVSFDGSAKTQKYGGYGSCSWIVWRLPEWQIVIAASAYLETTTVNVAEYTGMNNGVLAALEHGAEDLVVVGDSKLAIQQSLGVMACRKESLMTLQNRHKELTARLRSVKYLHVVREYNAAADSLAGEALETKVSKVILSKDRQTELSTLNRIPEMIYEALPNTSSELTPRTDNFVQVLDAQVRSICDEVG